MNVVTVRIGFIGSYRFKATAWCHKMFEDSLAALARVKGMETVVPPASPDSESPNDGSIGLEKGATPYGMVSTLDEAEAAAEYLKSQKVDGLIICPLDFGDERAASKVAEKLKVPVLLYATKEPPANDDAAMSRKSDSYCGNLTIAAGLYRRKIPFHFAGIFFPDHPEFGDAVQEFVRAVAVVKGVMGARLGQIGLRPEAFESVAYCEAALMRDFGQNVIPINLSQITEKVHGYDDNDPEVLAVIDDIRNQFGRITVSDASLQTAARLELALTEFWRQNRLSGQAMQCWGAGVKSLLGITPCVVFGRLTQKHMPTACEADVLGALAMLVGHRAALGETVPHFIDWTIQHRENPNRLLAWHCGNAPPCLAADDSVRSLRSRKDMKGEAAVAERDAFAGLGQFQIRSGAVTFCRLEYYDREWKMLIARGKIVPSEEVLAGTWSWVEVDDHDRLYRTLIEEGFIHHASMVHGDRVGALHLACKFLNIRPVTIDTD